MNIPLSERPRSTVAELLRQEQGTLPPAERKVCRALLSEYPLAGLEPVAELAERAGASAPTVLRLVGRLGFDGYPTFQRALKGELGERLSSPLQMYASRAPADEDGRPALELAATTFAEGIRSSLGSVPTDEINASVRLLGDHRYFISTIGGRFSGLLARYLAAHLRELRPRTRHVADAADDRAATLLDIGRKDAVVIFDYRRYQPQTIDFGVTAKRLGAKIILFTDPWLSPVAQSADIVLSSTVEAPSPFDSLVPALALVETLIAALIRHLGDEPRERIARYDSLSEAVSGATSDIVRS